MIAARIVEHAQGSAGWHEHRRHHLNASDLAAVMGLSRYKKRADLVRERATGIVADIDPATQRRFDQGHEFEALGRVMAEERLGEQLYPVVLAAEVEGLPLSASLDGQTLTGEVIFEHKTGRANLLAKLENGVIPDEYHPQLEQCMLLSGAERCMFMASNGDEDSVRVAWYESRPELRAQIIPAWRQFLADVAAYVPAEAVEPTPVGNAPETLPALHIEVSGRVTASNLAEFKSTALAAIRSVNKTLTTDQDFADAAKSIVWCSEVESRLAAAKEHALSQTADIDALWKTMDDISAEARRVRLDLDKLVTRRKSEVKEEVVARARRALETYIAQLNGELEPMRLPAIAADFVEAIKAKKSLASMQDGLDRVLAAAKIAAESSARAIRANVSTFKTQADGVEFLFADLGQIAHKAPDDFAAVLASRIAAHRLAEAEKVKRMQEAEAQRIAAAEQRAREQAVAQERAEQQRAANEAARVALAAAVPELPAVAAPQTYTPQPPYNVLPIAPHPEAPVEPATLNLGTICARLGFTMTAAFVADVLKVQPAKIDKSAKLYTEAQFYRVCVAIEQHCQNVRVGRREAVAA